MISLLEKLLLIVTPLYFIVVIVSILKDLKISTNKIATWLIIISALALATYLWNSKSTEDFGLNLFTEILGIVITLFIVQSLLNRDIKRKQLPRKFVLYNELTTRISNYVGGTKTFFAQHVPSNIIFPDKIEDFLNHNFMQNLWTRIDLNYVDSVLVAGYEEGYTNTHGSRIEVLSKLIIKSYRQLLENYSDIILEEEDLFIHINKVINSGFLFSCANLSRNHKQIIQNTGEAQIGLGYIRGIDASDLYESMIFINNLCKAFYRKHKSNKNLFEPYEYAKHNPART